MTEAERQALIEDISNAVITRLNQNSIDWSSKTISFNDRYDIQVSERQNIKIPAIDKRNGIVYGNLDLNALLTAYGMTQALKSVSDAEEAGINAVNSIENATSSAMSSIDSKSESEKAEITTHANSQKGTISTATSNAIVEIEQTKDSVKGEVSATGTSEKNAISALSSSEKSAISSLASSEKTGISSLGTTQKNEITTLSASKKSELDAIVATGIKSIVQTESSSDSGGSNVLTITQTNGTPTQFIVKNGERGEKGEKGDSVDTYTKTEIDNKIANAGGNVDLSGYLKLSGGVMTGSVTLEGATLNKPLVVSGGDSATAGKIIFGTNGQITNESTATLVGRIGESFYIGHSTYPVYLRGKNTRPYYNNANTTLALSSDIPTSLPASDVYSWAKASTKPSYSASEVGAVPTSRTVNGKALSSNISISASDIGATSVSYYVANNIYGTATIPSMSAKELKIVSLSNNDYEAFYVKLPSGGTYVVLNVSGSQIQGKTYSGNA